MNEFTKEELIVMWLSVSGKMYRSLKDKLQFVIDNYCEHRNHDGEVEIFVDVCRDCDSLLLRTKTLREHNE